MTPLTLSLIVYGLSAWALAAVLYFLYREAADEARFLRTENTRLLEKMAYQIGVDLSRSPSAPFEPHIEIPTPTLSFFRMKPPPPLTPEEQAAISLNLQKERDRS